MTISVEEARKVMGKEANKYTDEQMVEMVNTLEAIADLAIDSWLAKTPEERRQWMEKNKKQSIEV